MQCKVLRMSFTCCKTKLWPRLDRFPMQVPKMQFLLSLDSYSLGKRPLKLHEFERRAKFSVVFSFERKLSDDRDEFDYYYEARLLLMLLMGQLK